MDLLMIVVGIIVLCAICVLTIVYWKRKKEAPDELLQLVQDFTARLDTIKDPQGLIMIYLDAFELRDDLRSLNPGASFMGKYDKLITNIAVKLTSLPSEKFTIDISSLGSTNEHVVQYCVSETLLPSYAPSLVTSWVRTTLTYHGRLTKGWCLLIAGTNKRSTATFVPDGTKIKIIDGVFKQPDK